MALETLEKPVPNLKDAVTGYSPSPAEVDALISRARRHPLGLDFLKNGALEAAAIIFEAHVFAVESARRLLA
ncbi:MAG: hypothetical protein HY928_17635 [Elusimicrobia bacterium]|nr:hypothetical protein [Elusimicrobiota bacterium]